MTEAKGVAGSAQDDTPTNSLRVGSEDLSSSDLRRLTHLKAMLDREDVRYLGYPECEAATERLGARLRETIPDLEEWQFAAMPRGGLIVLGMLAYILDLEPEQLHSSTDRFRPLVLVDDVAMTGASLRQKLSDLSDRRVIVAHLASPQELREMVEEEDNVVACVAALDLEALDDELDPDRRAELRASWAQRLSGPRFWHGRAQLIAFPWSEPDHIMWNPETSQIETGWRLISPESSLKSRAALGPPSPDRKARNLRFPPDMAHGRFDDGYLVCRLDTEDLFRLDRNAATIWGALGTLGDIEKARSHLEQSGVVEFGATTEDLTRFSEELEAAGLLVRDQESG